MLVFAGPQHGLEGLRHGALQRVAGHVGLTLKIHAFVSMLIRLQLSLVHCSHGIPLKSPPLGLRLAGVSVNLHIRRQLILSPYRQPPALVDSFVERHLTSAVHSAHVRTKVLSPCGLGHFLRPARGLDGLLVHPLHRSHLLIVW